MLNYAQLKRLNERSMAFNGPMKAIFIKGIEGEDNMPYVSYRYVNTKQKGDYRMSVLDFISKTIAMELYAVNIENIYVSEFFECYDVIGNEIIVKASYSDLTGILSVYVYDTLLAVFLAYELMEHGAIENICQKIIKACEIHRIPLGEHGKDNIECEIKRCMDEEVSSKRPMPIHEFLLSDWFFEEEKFFNEE